MNTHLLRLKLNKFFLLVSLFAFIIPLYILAFYNHPQNDDYNIGYHMHNENFWSYQRLIYNHWSGRYCTFFLHALFAYNNFIFKYYYFHTILLLTVTFILSYLLLYAINKHFFKSSITKYQLYIIAGIFFCLQLSSIPEMSSAFYWYTGAIAYQIGFCLLLLELFLVIILLHTNSMIIKFLNYLILVFIIILINGNSEPIALIQGLILTFFVLIRRKEDRVWAVVIMLTYFISLYIAFNAPGNKERAISMNNQSGVMKAFLFAGGRTIYTLWLIFKNPLFWSSIAATLVFFQSKKFSLNDQRNSIIEHLSKYGLIWISIIVFIVYLPIMYVTNGSFPERSTNTMVLFALLLLLGYIFIIAIKFGNQLKHSFIKLNKNIFLTIIAVTIIANNGYLEIFKSTLSAIVYDEILSIRENEFIKASQRKDKVAYILSYNTHLEKLLNTKYITQREQVKNIMKNKPSLLFFEDDLSNELWKLRLQMFYNLNKIVLDKSY